MFFANTSSRWWLPKLVAPVALGVTLVVSPAVALAEQTNVSAIEHSATEVSSDATSVSSEQAIGVTAEVTDNATAPELAGDAQADKELVQASSSELEAKASESLDSKEAEAKVTDFKTEEAQPTESASEISNEAESASISSQEAESPSQLSDVVVEQPKDNVRSNTDNAKESTQGSEQASEKDSKVVLADPSAPKKELTYLNIYRMYNPNSGEHFYTSDIEEAKHIFSVGWRWEGIGWVSPSQGTAVYRLYNKGNGDHFYTSNLEEIAVAVAKHGWTQEGIAWYDSQEKDAIAIWRQNNPNAQVGAHNYTSSQKEVDNLVKAGWDAEGKAFSSANKAPSKIKGFWAVSPAWGTTERYWVDEDGKLAYGRIIKKSEGAGYYAYATTEKGGAVLRGAKDMGNGTVLLADNDGRLETRVGMIVTSKYDNGNLRRYYMLKRDGYSVAQSGQFSDSKNNHYWGVAGLGYVVTGKYRFGRGMLIANSEGVLAVNQGWVVTDKFDGETRRYYFADLNGKKLFGALVGYFEKDGHKYYGEEENGYVVQNKYYIDNFGDIIYANNDGHVSRANLTGAMRRAWMRIRNYSSRQPYLIAIDSDACKVLVFEGAAGRWIPKFDWDAGVGAPYLDGEWINYGAGTPKSENYYIGERGASYDGSGDTSKYRVEYYSRDDLYFFTGFLGDCGFHSTIGWEGGYADPGQIGRKISHGCVRLLIQNAKWIYDNCLPGTRVVSY